ncbi:fatty acid desaturase [Bdellovibrio sp. NC01]|uniref:fatty acid desaturase n=1 Tax=Bdellovibrio sp. NC01 TaxID=2220073 RepID=UPI00143DE145|nr:fatty acid desaturase [Bdellovibrio sp. NC01]
MAISTALLYEGLVTPVGWWSLALIPASCLFFYICFTINHNQLHLGMFRATPLNIAANILLSLCTGVPVTMIYLPHVQNHHPNPCNGKDWAGAHLVDGHQGLWRALIYIAKAQIAPMKMRPRSLFAGLNTYRKSSLCLEALALGIYIAYALYAHPVSFLLHNLLPWFLSMNALILMNFALHDGCDYDSKLDHSLTFTTKIGNYFLLNNGYHLAHHEQPKMHWSKLPHYHNETVKPRARTEFEKVSILKHLRLMYFFIPKVAKNEVVAKKT